MMSTVRERKKGLMNYSEISRCTVVDGILKSRSEAGKPFIAMAWSELKYVTPV